MTTANSNILTLSGRVFTINSAGTFSPTSITATGFLKETSFNLTTPTSAISKTYLASSISFTNTFTQNTLQVSNLVAGLYICEYCICVSNQSGSTANIFRFEANVQDTTAQQNQIHSHHNRESINIPNGFFHMHRNTFTFVNPATRSYILQ